MSQRAFLRGLQHRLEDRVATCPGLAGITVIDLAGVDTGPLAVNPDLVFAIGSSIKIPVLLALYLKDERGELDVRQSFTVTREHLIAGSGVLQHLDHPLTLAVEDLATLMINVSDNIATNILIDLVGLDYVNSLLDELGLPETRLRRKMIDSAAAARGDENTSTPRESARLMELLYRGEAVDEAACERVLRILTKPKRTSPVAAKLPMGLTIANKPGGLEGVSADLAVVYLERRPYVFAGMVNYALGDDPAETVAEMSYDVYEYFAVLNRSTMHGRRLALDQLT